MPDLKPYKFIVQAVCQQVDGDGTVLGEAQTEAVTVFGLAGLARYAADFEDNLALAAAAGPMAER